MMFHKSPYPELKSAREIKKMRAAGRVVGKALYEISKMAAPGVTTQDFEDRAAEIIRQAGGIPMFKDYPNPSGPDYPPFPTVLCTSPNEVIVHGIPNKNPLKRGDIVSVDCGVKLDGFIGDSAITVAIGELAPEIDALVRATKRSLELAIEQCRVGRRLGDISYAVQSYTEPLGYGVVRDYCGHGVGRQLHEEPQVPNYGRPGTGLRLKAGLCIAIEPMITLGTWRTETLDDTWTVVTKDLLPAAHFEHSIAITADGPIILTAYDPKKDA